MKAIFFDLDGTLLDTLPDLAAAVNIALRAHKFPPRSKTEIARFMGSGNAALMRAAAPESAALTDETAQALLADFKEAYYASCTAQTHPYEGVPELLRFQKAQGLRLAVLSNKNDPATQKICKALLPPVFDLILGETGALRRKPDPDMLLYAAKTFSLPTEECLYVGDSENDLLAARGAGMRCVCVTWGYRSEETLLAAGANAPVRSPGELWQTLFPAQKIEGPERNP